MNNHAVQEGFLITSNQKYNGQTLLRNHRISSGIILIISTVNITCEIQLAGKAFVVPVKYGSDQTV